MKKENREKLYKISEVAEILGVHEDTLRNWEREGFVVPERIGTRSDRRYTAEMVGKIREQGLVSDLAKKSPTNKKDLAEYTKDELIKELQLLKKQKKYGLVWEYHIEEVVERCKTEAPILVVKKDKQIKDIDKNKPTNILIEGDNYHALQVLNYTHKDKIDVIYIDPPYNTGNKDFVYNDSYVDKEDTFRHSKWLSFMEKRLVLAKKLMKKDGVIFISIDDNEQAQLRILCNGIFGEDNFLGDLIWQKQGNDNKSIFSGVKTFRNDHEYILVYGRNASLVEFYRPEEVAEFKNDYGNADNDPRGNWMSAELGKSDARSLPHGKNYYTLTSLVGTKWTRQWHYSEKEMETLIKENRVYFGKDETSVPRFKKFLDEKTSKVPSSLLTKYGSTKTGQTELDEIFGERLFLYPKSTILIEYLIRLHSNKFVTVLDFMAGSGTTGHAVLDLNKEDGGNRKFILCTNNELNGLEKELREKGLKEEEIEEYGICRRITHKRIEKVIKGYTKPNGEKVEGLGGSLEYFKTEFVDVENIDKVSDKKKLEFTYEAGQMIALKEDAFKEVTKNKFYQIFTDEKDKFVGIYFRENLDKLSEMEEKILDKKDVKLYLFSYGVNDFKKDYSEYKNVTVKDIPEPVLKIYKSLNN